MELKNTFKYHLLLAVIIIAMHILDEYKKFGDIVFSEKLGLGIVYLIAFNIAFFGTYIYNYKILCPLTIAKKKIFLYLLCFVSVFFVFAGLRYFMEEVILYNITGFHNYSDTTRKFWFYIFDNAYHALKAGLFSVFMYFLFNHLKGLNRIHQLQLSQQKAELDILKTQLEPHFLFNTLNAFYSELAEKQPKTAKGIFKLSELLRYLTYEAKKDFMPLRKELKFIEDYIYLYEKRFENNFFLNLNIEGEITSQKIPSLLLIHFVENILKHGITNEKDNPAKIEITIAKNHLTVTTKNKISNVKNYSSSGIGKENLEKRLKLLLEKNYELKIDEPEGIYKTYLKIPLKD